MKKVVLVVSVAILSIAQGFSQDKGFVAVSIGNATPTGNFGSMDTNNSDAGLAKSGLMFDLSAGFKLKKQFGLTALLRSQANGLDVQPLANDLSNQLPSGITGTVQSDNWTSASFLVGGYGCFEIAKKLDLEPRLMVGYTSLTMPILDIRLSNGATVTQAAATSGDFGYLVGAGIKYNFDDNWCLLFNLDYAEAKVDFKDVAITSNVAATSKQNFSMKFSSFNSNIGIGYKF